MVLRIYNGLQIETPDEWRDLSTLVFAPAAAEGARPSINLVVKRRSASAGPASLDEAVSTYARFVAETFGVKEGLEQRDVAVGSLKGRAVRFSASNKGEAFSQTTLFYFHAGEEVTATVTQLGTDTTDAKQVDRLLRSVKPLNMGSRS